MLLLISLQNSFAAFRVALLNSTAADFISLVASFNSSLQFLPKAAVDKDSNNIAIAVSMINVITISKK
jgi:hypothetical protein